MKDLNPEQKAAVESDGNVVVTACPGSGKTRVLAARVVRGVCELESSRERVVALTFTNRAADEIQSRLDEEGICSDCLWAGTIHAFALEWVLRPYAPYGDVTRLGFSVADEFRSEQLIAELRAEAGLKRFDKIDTAYTRTGTNPNVGNGALVGFSSGTRAGCGIRSRSTMTMYSLSPTGCSPRIRK